MLCPYCAEHISSAAEKCKHCGEFLSSGKKWSRLFTRIAAVLGIATASLSVFYAIREGYFYVEQRNQHRMEIASYLAVAEKFQNLDSLEYAQQALTKAVSLSPNNTDLQRKLFILNANALLRDIEWHLASTEQLAIVRELILDGFRLLESPSSSSQKNRLLVILARLLPQDGAWNDENGVIQLFEQALEIDDRNAEAMFHYGQWLTGTEIDLIKGLELIKQACHISPENAYYLYELGNLYLNQKNFQAALPVLRRARDLLPKQRDLTKIRAANFAKQALRSLLIEADRTFDITQGHFLQLDRTARKALIDEVLSQKPKDRVISLIATRFAIANEDFQTASQHLIHTMSESDFDKPVMDYNLHLFEMQQDILLKLEPNSIRLKELQSKITEYRQLKGYQESLEWGIEGRLSYKIGLRVKSQNDQKGVKVLKAYSGYPFAHAGVTAEDQITMFAHRKVTSLRSIQLLIDRFEHGSTVPMTVLRNGSLQELQLIVE